jgi:hypothetical protein
LGSLVLKHTFLLEFTLLLTYDTGFWWGNLSERDKLEDAGVDGRIILRWIFKKWDLRALAGSV